MVFFGIVLVLLLVLLWQAEKVRSGRMERGWEGDRHEEEQKK